MFLDIKNLSKNVDRHGTEHYHVLSSSSRFLVAVLSEQQPVIVERGPFLQKTAKNGKKQALTGKNRSFKLVKIFEFYIILHRNQFFSCFHTVFPLFLACLQSFKGLSKHGRRSVDSRSRVCRSRSRPFLYFPIKICLLMASLVAHWSNTTKRFLRSTVFAVVSGMILSQTSFAMRSHIALLCNTWATCRRLERRLDSRREEGEA